MTRFTSSTAVGRAVVATANARGTPIPAEPGGANTALVPPDIFGGPHHGPLSQTPAPAPGSARPRPGRAARPAAPG
ncbi:hypothetical protein CP971_03910 [Streptomyces viridifaciens]|nr:hypothetical protein CP971_03910 [Streptomyces viridifaciens]